MAKSAPRSIELGSFAPGVNNRLEPTQLAKKLADGSVGQYLYGADNVDVNERGFLKRRRGQTPVISGQAHSLWADDLGGFVVLNGILKAFDVNDAGIFVGADVRTGMPKALLSYSRGADGDVYWSNGASLRRIARGEDRPVITPPPALVPVLVTGSGALAEGTYLATFTASGLDGESPATPVVAVTVPANSSIGFSAAQALNFYLSAPDGDILTLQGSGTAYTAYTWYESARRCMTLNRMVMPAGQIVRHHRGSLLVAVDNVLYISDPYNYGVCNPSKGYIPFPARIDMIESTDNGAYICADQTYWCGNLMDDVLQVLLPYGAVPRTSGRSPNDTHVFWQSQRGLVIADRNTSVKNVQEEALQFEGAEAGASFYREVDGMTHIVVSRKGNQPNTAAAGTFMDAEVIRKGTVL